MQNAKRHLPLSLKIGNKRISQFTHPSVIDFKTEHHKDTWAGYRYWMVLTPLPYSNDSYENPSLCASQDGIHWECPEKITNPLDAAEGGLDKGFHSDPEMIYNPDTDELWIYYRFLTHKLFQMKLLRIKQDLVVGKPAVIMSQNDRDIHFELKSMAIVRESADKWHMWGGSRYGYARLEDCPPNNSLYLFSKDGITWSEPQFCYNKEGIDPYYAIGYSNWHTSCKYNPYTNKVDFLCFCHNRKEPGNNKIIYSSCTLDKPRELLCLDDSIVLETSDCGWDNQGIYRCAFVIERGDKGLIYHVWYAGINNLNIIQRSTRAGRNGVIKYLKFCRPAAEKIPKSLYMSKWHIGYTSGSIDARKK